MGKVEDSFAKFEADNMDEDDAFLVSLYARGVAALASGMSSPRMNNEESKVKLAKRYERYILTGE